MHHLILDLDDLVGINRVWLHKDLKVSDLQPNANLAQLVKNWALKPVLISCIRSSPTCCVIKTKSWLNITHGFIPRKIQWHIHTGQWSLVNWVVQSTYETLYKRHMNINEMALRMASAFMVIGVSARYPDTTGGNFFVVVKSFDANTAISANFVLTVKNSNEGGSHKTTNTHKTRVLSMTTRWIEWMDH